MMGFPNGTLRRLEFANKAIADELPVLHSRSAIIGDPESLLWVITRIHLFRAYVSFHQLRTYARISLPLACAITGREQVQQHEATFHSITLSARIKSVSGMTRPIALAVLRLITSSNVVGCWTGRSCGRSPRSSLATEAAI